MNPLQYVPGQSADLDRLAEVYRQHAGEVPPDVTERPTTDPLGHDEAPVDQERASLEVAERLLNFFVLLREEFCLEGPGTVFAAELFAMNVLNAPDLPLDDKQVADAQKKARRYWREHT